MGGTPNYLVFSFHGGERNGNFEGTLCILQSHLPGLSYSFTLQHPLSEPLHWLLLWPRVGIFCHLGVDPFTVTLQLYFMPIVSVDLERFTERCRLSGFFISEIWLGFEVSIRIIAFLDTFTQARVFLTCLVVQVDRSDVALGATSIRLQCAQLPWTVATPPVQAYHPVSSSASPWWDSSSSSDHGPEAQEG